MYKLLQVTTLVSSKSPQMKKGKSKRAIVLVAAVEKATQNFVERGEVSCHWSIVHSHYCVLIGCFVQVIALEHPEIEHEMLACVEEVRDPNTNI